ncbi:hypothetical protein BSKO_03971 [Bryopsis sp. KO-2023]|nr:hypothetical protein BSKO_03971 [Bryopsis sp. KO-2023]
MDFEVDVPPTTALDSVRRDVDAFLLSLPLGTDRASADVEEAVARRLIRCEVERLKLQKKMHQWVQVATELYKIVEEQQSNQRMGIGTQGFNHHPVGLYGASTGVENMIGGGGRHFLDEADVEYSPNRGRSQVVLWQDRSQPRSFLQPQGVLSDIHNLKQEVATLKLKIGSENRLPQPTVVGVEASTRACECCEVLRTQLNEQLKDLTGANEEKATLRRSLLDAEIELQKLTAVEESSTKRVQESESSVVHLKANQAQLLRDLEQEKMSTREAKQQLQNSKARVEELKMKLESEGNDFESQRKELALQKSREDALMNEVEAKAVEVVELKSQLEQLVLRIGELEGEVQAQEISLHGDLATQSQHSKALERENQILQKRAQEMESELDEVAARANGEERMRIMNDELRRKVSGMEEELSESGRKRTALDSDLREKNFEVERLRNALETVEAAAKEANEKLQLLHRESNELTTQLQSTQGELDAQNLKSEEVNSSAAKLETENSSLSKQLTELSKECAEAKQAAKKSVGDLEKARQKKEEVKKISDLQNEEIGKLRAKMSMRDCELKSLSSNVEALEKELERQKASSSVSRILDLQRELNASAEEINNLRTEIIQIRQDLNLSRAENSGLSSRLEASADVVANLEKKLATASRNSIAAGASNEITSSMRRLQGLLYSREKELRRVQLKVEDLQGRLRWWEDGIHATKGPPKFNNETGSSGQSMRSFKSVDRTSPDGGASTELQREESSEGSCDESSDSD